MMFASPRRLRAAVVGLGQVGSRFDEDPGRKVAWSHVGAYLALADRFELVVAAEILPANVEAFSRRCPGTPVVGDPAALADFAPDVVSICTPAVSHGAILHTVLNCPSIKAVWCEKPMAEDLAEAEAMVAGCRERGIAMLVSFNRHWLPLWLRLREIVAGGSLGTVRSVRVSMPNRLFSIGSHAVDLALTFGGPVEAVRVLELPALAETGEPAVSALVRYQSGASGLIQVTGFKSRLIVEVEVIGDDGRVLAREDRGTITIETFRDSPFFCGYRQLADARVETLRSATDFSAFVAMAEEIHAAVTTDAPLSCDGTHALAVQRMLALMASPTVISTRIWSDRQCDAHNVPSCRSGG